MMPEMQVYKYKYCKTDERTPLVRSLQIQDNEPPRKALPAVYMKVGQTTNCATGCIILAITITVLLSWIAIFQGTKMLNAANATRPVLPSF
ncbi:hypothetical protein Ocin01_13646 [Orchesella cincta]|uniref:Uncharacterized protein n=1 Tax=Orchesella cincta TaxID=48709 RepID=A0A1D2MJ49_ORCCI|nr:hypothetical protein Ocin01_13646 [Orchesella cincta]